MAMSMRPPSGPAHPGARTRGSLALAAMAMPPPSSTARPSARWKSGLALVAIALTLAMAPPAGARCRTPEDVRLVAASVQATLACAAVGDPTCATAPPAPTCAPALAHTVRNLTFGPGATDAAIASVALRRCLAAVATSVSRATVARLSARILGRRPAYDPRRLAGPIAACREIRSASSRANYLRAGCLARATRPEGSLDPTALARCLAPGIETAVDAVVPPRSRPNILLVITDDQRPESLAAMPRTLARIAAEGVQFRNAFSTTAICAPSRASLLTGQVAHHHGLVGNGGAAAFDHASTLGPRLAALGYRTGFFGKYLNDNAALGERSLPGWDAWHTFLEAAGGAYFGFQLNQNGRFTTFPAPAYSTDVLADLLEGFVRDSAGQPFFAVFAPFAPHAPAAPAERHAGSFDGLPRWRPPNWQEAGVATKPSYVRWHQAVATPADASERDALRQRGFETLLAVDEAIERTAALLDELDIAEETVIVFTSDHGIHWGEHWLGTKFTAYEEAIRVPLLMRIPGTRPAVRDEMVANIDLAPTLLELAGSSPTEALDGVSLVPLLGGSPGSARRELLIENSSGYVVRANRALRTPRWKYIETREDVGFARELYDLDSDPFELTNLAADPAHGGRTEQMARRLRALAARR